MDKNGRSDTSEIGQNPGTVVTDYKLEFVNTDAVGSPIVATNFDQRYVSQPYNSQQGIKVWTQNYFPYGERREKWSANYGKDHTQWFGGKPLDTDTGLSYFGARFYDPAVGRFMGIDPVGANPASIHLQNRYAYANNNPYKYGDPDGRLPVFLAPLAWNVGRFIVTEAVAMAVEAYAPVDIPLSKKGLLQKAVRDGIKDLPGGVVKGVAKSAPEITKAYKRPSGATTKAQRDSVQGKPCVDCGATTPKQYADHKDPLVKEYYRTGTIDKTRMRDIDSVQPQCPTCSNKQGAEMSRFSRQQKKDLGL